MTKIKLCGLSRICDIETANEWKPEYVGFIFAQRSHRYVTPQQAKELKCQLHSQIKAVGVFVEEKPEIIADYLNEGIIDLAQLHGDETEKDIAKLRRLTDRPIIKAFSIRTTADIVNAKNSTADFVLLDSGGGTGTTFDWDLIQDIHRPYFLAGGLGPHNVKNAIAKWKPYAADVSSGIETNGQKDKNKISKFIATVREEERV